MGLRNMTPIGTMLFVFEVLKAVLSGLAAATPVVDASNKLIRLFCLDIFVCFHYPHHLIHWCVLEDATVTHITETYNCHTLGL